MKDKMAKNGEAKLSNIENVSSEPKDNGKIILLTCASCR